MKHIVCRLGRLKASLSLPALPLAIVRADGAVRNVASIFASGSTAIDGHRGIDLEMDPAFTDVTIAEERPSDLGQLHTALRRLVQNPPAPAAIDRIGVLFADEFPGHDRLFGLMFDVGFQADGLLQDVGAHHIATPREGCAVFLDAIARNRTGDAAIRAETVFTAIHELGHVFNLPHLSNPAGFMSQSPANEPFGDQAFGFDGTHREFLRRCDTEPAVSPGGLPWDDRGTLTVARDSGGLLPANAPILDLRLAALQEEFWFFEPVELDITLRSASKHGVTVPDVIDPGYDGFDLWIEEPGGERRRYRSPVLYCQNEGQISLRSGRPFTRDLSVFGQGGGYTFRKAGRHKLWAVLRLGGADALVSNVVELCVRSMPTRRTQYERFRTIMTHDAHARLFFYRSTQLAGVDVAALRKAATLSRQMSRSANVDFSLGCVFAKRSRLRSRAARKASKEVARRHLGRALDSGLLSKHRQQRGGSVYRNLLEP